MLFAQEFLSKLRMRVHWFADDYGSTGLCMANRSSGRAM